MDDVGDEMAYIAEHLRLIIVAAALLVVAALLGVAALSLVIVGVGRNRRKGGFAGRNQPVDDRLPDKLTALGRDRCQRLQRSEERRVGKECVSTCRFRWSPYP